MKNQLKKVLLSFCLIIVPLTIKTEPSADINMQQMPTDMQMPSVAEIFGGMSEEEITKQVQEAQKMFESLSPEEMAEFEKIIEQTIQTMSPQDLEDIQGIAKMVEPHLDLPKEEPKMSEKKTQETTQEEQPKKKTKKEPSDTETIQQLIDNISYQINDILQKINSDKSLIEDALNKWPSKTTLDNMKRQIIALKQDRLAKKLTLKENSEDKELVQKLEFFYKELSKLNETFEVEDTFGIPQSKAQSDALIKQTKEIFALFDDTIDNLMPILEKFLRKYDPEALQMAKEAEERAKYAQAHTKDSEVKRGSAPAISAPTSSPSLVQQPTGGTNNQYAPGLPQYDSGFYDQYGTPYGSGFDYPGAKGFGETPTQGIPKTKDDSKQAKSAKSESKNDALDKQTVDSENAFDEAEELLNKYFDKHKDQTVTIFNDFLDNEVEKAYPNATMQSNSLTPVISLTGNAAEQKNWLTSDATSSFKSPLGFKAYIDNLAAIFNAPAAVSKNIDTIIKEIKDTHKKLEKLSDYVTTMSEANLIALKDHKLLSKLKIRFLNYETKLNQTIQEIDKTYSLNKTVIDDKTIQSDYEKEHNALKNNLLLSFNIHEVLEEIVNLEQEIKRAIDKKSKKKKSKARQSINY